MNFVTSYYTVCLIACDIECLEISRGNGFIWLEGLSLGGVFLCCGFSTLGWMLILIVCC